MEKTCDTSHEVILFSTRIQSWYISSVYTSENVIEPYPTITTKTIAMVIFLGISTEGILEIFGIFFLKKYNPKIIALENISRPANGPVSYVSIFCVVNPIFSNELLVTESEINAGNTIGTKLINTANKAIPKTTNEIFGYGWLWLFGDDLFFNGSVEFS